MGTLFSVVLAFSLETDSVEMAYMKTQFHQVNLKMDIVISKLDKLEDLITYESQRAQYLKYVYKIEFGHKQLLKYLDEIADIKCSDKQSCTKQRIKIAERYLPDFVIELSYFAIMTGATDGAFFLGEPLLLLLQRLHDCDTGKLKHFMDYVIHLAFKVIIIYM